MEHFCCCKFRSITFTEAIFAQHNVLVRKGKTVQIPLGNIKKCPLKQMQKEDIQINFVHFEETRKTYAVVHPATNDWRTLHLGTFLLLQIPIDHIHRSHIYNAHFLSEEWQNGTHSVWHI